MRGCDMGKFIKSFLMLCLLFTGFIFAQTDESSPVYVQTIATPDKSLDFIVGLYPQTYKWNDELLFSSMKLCVLNNADTPLEWNNYWVYILLNDNTTLFFNYKTKADNGEFACDYTVNAGKMHEQCVCFDKKFDFKDIKKVWLSVTSGNFIEMIYTNPAEKN
jgi:hypothetical protein